MITALSWRLLRRELRSGELRLLFAALLKWTAIHYLVARVIVSVFAGLAMFVLNAVLNFRQV